MTISKPNSIESNSEDLLQEAEQVLQIIKNNPDKLVYAILKNNYEKLLATAFKKAKFNSDWAGVIPALLNLNILDKSDKEYYKELLATAFEKESKKGW